jgi:hypothetical protein
LAHDARVIYSAAEGTAMINDGKQSGGITCRLRWVLYWIALATLLQAGCSDNTAKDLETCKMKTIERYKPPGPEATWDHEPLTYLRNCMGAAGYKVDLSAKDERGLPLCNDPPGALLLSCWR